MPDKIYIRASSSISPQNSFGDGMALDPLIAHEGQKMIALEPDYSKIIDPKLIRRMSRIIKMGVAAALDCIKKSGTSPDAIITGTAYGCLEDTEIFLSRMIQNKEDLLSPTAFIQSTHNTVGAQIALLLKCHEYNNTFVHRGFSFENALLDAILLLSEGEKKNVLVGGVDELTSTAHQILSRFGLYRKYPISNLDLIRNPGKGTMAGEGSSFFLLTTEPSEENLASLDGLSSFFKPASSKEIERAISYFLEAHNVEMNEIDLVINGKNGDARSDEIYAELNQSIFSGMNLASYKHLCGEYPTSAAFALWLASIVAKTGSAPSSIQDKDGPKSETIRKILIYNQYQVTHHSLFLVSAC
jgi:3-oxoacyl-(acyl-carrier-protein) synthase